MKIQVVARGFYALRLMGSILVGGLLAICFLDILDLQNPSLVNVLLLLCLFTYLLYRLTATMDKGEAQMEITAEGLEVTSSLVLTENILWSMLCRGGKGA